MKRLPGLIQLVRPYYSSTDPAHDWAHVGRVSANAKALAEAEDVSLACVLAAVYCHDLINLPKDHPERKEASTLTANEARSLLIKSGFNADEIELISKAIVEHSFSKGLRPTSKVSAIVQDADRLDALGAIGILRCAAISTQMKSSFYEPFDPLAEQRELNDKTFMLDHYYVKLFQLPGLMNTSKGKRMGEERVAFMKEFIKVLMGEVR